MPKLDSLTLGIDLSDREIRAVVVDLAGETPLIRATRSFALPTGAIASGVIQDQNAVIGVLRELSRSLGLSPTTRTIVGVSSALVTTRVLSIPPCDDREIPGLVEGELEHQGLSVEGEPLETIVFPHRVGGHGSGMRNVSVILADPKVVWGLKDVVESAGFRVEAVETTQTGKLRAAALALPFAATTFFLVLGPHVTGVSYFSGPDLVATRRIDVGVTTLVRGYEGELGLQGGDGTAPLRVDHAAIDRLAIESLQMMEFVQRDYAEEIESVRIYAIEPELEILAPMLERRFGIPTTFSPPPTELGDVRYSVAYGLAIRDFQGPFKVPRLDLTAKLRRESDDRESKRNFFGSLLTSGVALLVGAVAFVCYSRLVASLDQRAQKASAQLNQVRSQVASIRDERQTHDARYRALRREGVPIGAVMDDVAGDLDSGVRLKSVGVGADLCVRIQGEARDEAALGRMTQHLQTSAVLKDVCLVQLDRSSTPGSVPFTFEIDATTIAADRMMPGGRS